MNIERMISTVEVHTGGEPFRLVEPPGLGGGKLDKVREALIYEPRGHADMYAGYLTEPVSDEKRSSTWFCSLRIMTISSTGFGDVPDSGIANRDEGHEAGDRERVKVQQGRKVDIFPYMQGRADGVS